MPPTTIHEAPILDSYTPLAEHQSQTPSTFYNAKPVLHYHTTDARATVSRDYLSKLPIFPTAEQPGANDAVLPRETPQGNRLWVVVDVFVTSEYVSYFSLSLIL